MTNPSPATDKARPKKQPRNPRSINLPSMSDGAPRSRLLCRGVSKREGRRRRKKIDTAELSFWLSDSATQPPIGYIYPATDRLEIHRNRHCYNSPRFPELPARKIKKGQLKVSLLLEGFAFGNSTDFCCSLFLPATKIHSRLRWRRLVFYLLAVSAEVESGARTQKIKKNCWSTLFFFFSQGVSARYKDVWGMPPQSEPLIRVFSFSLTPKKRREWNTPRCPFFPFPFL